MQGACKFCSKQFSKRYTKQIFCSLPCSNRFNLNNKNKVALPETYSTGLAELFGILLGDGSVTRYFVKVYLNRVADADYVPYVKRLMSDLFPGAPATLQDRPEGGTAELQISSRDVCDYLRHIGFNAKKRYIPAWIRQDDGFTKATVRGLFDTEGSVGMKYFFGVGGMYLYKQLTVTNKNENILRFLERSLRRFGYKPTQKSCKNIYISNKRDIQRYANEVGSSNPKIVRKIKIEEIDGHTWRVAPNGKAPVLKTGAPKGA